MSESIENAMNGVPTPPPTPTPQPTQTPPTEIPQIVCQLIPQEPQPSTSRPIIDFETLFQNYLKAFNDRMTALDPNDIQTKDLETKKLEDVYLRIKKINTTYLKSTQYRKLMEVFAKEVTEMDSVEKVVRHHRDLTIELFRFAQKPEKKNLQKVKDKNAKVKKLTDTLKKLQKEIFAAENQELDLDDLNSESVYTDLPKLYRKVHDVWVKREELLKRSTNTGRSMFKKYKCVSTPYPEINKCVETLLNNHLKKMKNKTTKGYVDESFTFIDVRKAILELINEKQLSIMNSETMIQNLYEELLKVKRQRRQQDSEEVFETLEALDDLKPETIAEDSPQMELELAKNKKSFEQRMEELFEKYAKEDKQKNGESVLSGGLCEWETETDLNINNNNEGFESIDVKEGDLEDEESDDSSKESEEDIEMIEPIPNSSANGTTEDPTLTANESAPNGSTLFARESEITIKEASKPELEEPDIKKTKIVESPFNKKEPEVITIDDNSSDVEDDDDIMILS